MSSPDSNNQDESREAEAGAREGSDPIEALVTPAQILQALTALVDSTSAQAARLMIFFIVSPSATSLRHR